MQKMSMSEIRAEMKRRGITGISEYTIESRLRRGNMTTEEAFGLPVLKGSRQAAFVSRRSPWRNGYKERNNK